MNLLDIEKLLLFFFSSLPLFLSSSLLSPLSASLWMVDFASSCCCCPCWFCCCCWPLLNCLVVRVGVIEASVRCVNLSVVIMMDMNVVIDEIRHSCFYSLEKAAGVLTSMRQIWHQRNRRGKKRTTGKENRERGTRERGTADGESTVKFA